MKNRNAKTDHTPAYATRDADMLRARHTRNRKSRYEVRHNCDEYVNAFNLYGMEVEGED